MLKRRMVTANRHPPDLIKVYILVSHKSMLFVTQ